MIPISRLHEDVPFPDFAPIININTMLNNSRQHEDNQMFSDVAMNQTNSSKYMADEMFFNVVDQTTVSSLKEAVTNLLKERDELQKKVDACDRLFGDKNSYCWNSTNQTAGSVCTGKKGINWDVCQRTPMVDVVKYTRGDAGVADLRLVSIPDSTGCDSSGSIIMGKKAEFQEIGRAHV